MAEWLSLQNQKEEEEEEDVVGAAAPSGGTGWLVMQGVKIYYSISGAISSQGFDYVARVEGNARITTSWLEGPGWNLWKFLHVLQPRGW